MSDVGLTIPRKHFYFFLSIAKHLEQLKSDEKGSDEKKKEVGEECWCSSLVAAMSHKLSAPSEEMNAEHDGPHLPLENRANLCIERIEPESQDVESNDPYISQYSNQEI